MPFDDASFDAVVCALTIHHVDDRASDITYWDTSDGAYLWTGPSPVAAGVIPNPTLSRHGTYMSTLTNSPEGVRISVETLDGVTGGTSSPHPPPLPRELPSHRGLTERRHLMPAQLRR